MPKWAASGVSGISGASASAQNREVDMAILVDVCAILGQ
jgi:hypothetical protein